MGQQKERPEPVKELIREGEDAPFVYDDGNEDRNVVRGTHPDIEADEDIAKTQGAVDALADMQAHERRRDQYYSTGGDNHSPGVDLDLDSNAPKEADMERKPTRNGSKGASDWK